LSDHSAVEPITIAINAGASMKRGEAVIGGQYWQQEGRSMTAVNGILEGMPNTRTPAILSAAVEAVVWKHPVEAVTPEGKRCSPRTVFYPADMPPIAEELGEFVSHSSDLEEGKHVAYAAIAEKVGEMDPLPNFFRDDSDMIRNDPILSVDVPRMLNTAAQVSVGCRDFVLENGPDVLHSSDEDAPEDDRGDVLTGMYIGDLKTRVTLSQSEVASQKAAVHALKSHGFWVNSDAPDSTSTTSYYPILQPSGPDSMRIPI
jgi:hypothetical protein